MEIYNNTSIFIISLDGKTGSNLVYLHGISDSNIITQICGSDISVIKNPTDTYTINAIATSGQYFNADQNLVIDNDFDTTNVSSAINVSIINNLSLNSSSGNISTIHNYQINSYNPCSANISAGNLTASYLAAVDLINVGDGSFSNISTLHNTVINLSTPHMSIINNLYLNSSSGNI